MDAEAEEEIVRHMNPQRGFESEINRVLGKNDSLSSSDSWNGATPQQKRALRSRMTSTTDFEGVKFQRNGKTYIRVDRDNYKRVTTESDVYVDEKNDRVWLRDEKGRFKEIVEGK